MRVGTFVVDARSMESRPSVLRNSWLVCIALLGGCTGTMTEGGTNGSPDAGGTTTPNPDGSTPQPTVLAKFNDWMKCMTLSDFRTANMTGAWNGLITENDERCDACHENGSEGFIVTPNEQKFFDVLHTNQYYALLFFTPKITDRFVVVENRPAMLGVSQGQDPHREHPVFDPYEGIEASARFVALTQAKFDAGQCP